MIFTDCYECHGVLEYIFIFPYIGIFGHSNSSHLLRYKPPKSAFLLGGTYLWTLSGLALVGCVSGESDVSDLTIIGSDGDDTLNGGPGNDDIRGGTGNDIINSGDDCCALVTGESTGWRSGIWAIGDHC
ncbi:MAG: hypothetical protein ISQ21_04665 [Alphaproteobacteria bacterium]|nr:hypothetical protein [Alphaproteobacteria bacterium]